MLPSLANPSRVSATLTAEDLTTTCTETEIAGPKFSPQKVAPPSTLKEQIASELFLSLKEALDYATIRGDGNETRKGDGKETRDGDKGDREKGDGRRRRRHDDGDMKFQQQKLEIELRLCSELLTRCLCMMEGASSCESAVIAMTRSFIRCLLQTETEAAHTDTCDHPRHLILPLLFSLPIQPIKTHTDNEYAHNAHTHNTDTHNTDTYNTDTYNTDTYRQNIAVSHSGDAVSHTQNAVSFDGASFLCPAISTAYSDLEAPPRLHQPFSSLTNHTGMHTLRGNMGTQVGDMETQVGDMETQVGDMETCVGLKPLGDRRSLKLTRMLSRALNSRDVKTFATIRDFYARIFHHQACKELTLKGPHIKTQKHGETQKHEETWKDGGERWLSLCENSTWRRSSLVTSSESESDGSVQDENMYDCTRNTLPGDIGRHGDTGRHENIGRHRDMRRHGDTGRHGDKDSSMRGCGCWADCRCWGNGQGHTHSGDSHWGDSRWGASLEYNEDDTREMSFSHPQPGLPQPNLPQPTVKPKRGCTRKRPLRDKVAPPPSDEDMEEGATQEDTQARQGDPQSKQGDTAMRRRRTRVTQGDGDMRRKRHGDEERKEVTKSGDAKEEQGRGLLRQGQKNGDTEMTSDDTEMTSGDKKVTSRDTELTLEDAKRRGTRRHPGPLIRAKTECAGELPAEICRCSVKCADIQLLMRRAARRMQPWRDGVVWKVRVVPHKNVTAETRREETRNTHTQGIETATHTETRDIGTASGTETREDDTELQETETETRETETETNETGTETNETETETYRTKPTERKSHLEARELVRSWSLRERCHLVRGGTVEELSTTCRETETAIMETETAIMETETAIMETETAGKGTETGGGETETARRETAETETDRQRLGVWVIYGARGRTMEKGYVIPVWGRKAEVSEKCVVCVGEQDTILLTHIATHPNRQPPTPRANSTKKETMVCASLEIMIDKVMKDAYDAACDYRAHLEQTRSNEIARSCAPLHEGIKWDADKQAWVGQNFVVPGGSDPKQTYKSALKVLIQDTSNSEGSRELKAVSTVPRTTVQRATPGHRRRSVLEAGSTQGRREETIEHEVELGDAIPGDRDGMQGDGDGMQEDGDGMQEYGDGMQRDQEDKSVAGPSMRSALRNRRGGLRNEKSLRGGEGEGDGSRVQGDGSRVQGDGSTDEGGLGKDVGRWVCEGQGVLRKTRQRAELEQSRQLTIEATESRLTQFSRRQTTSVSVIKSEKPVREELSARVRHQVRDANGKFLKQGPRPRDSEPGNGDALKGLKNSFTSLTNKRPTSRPTPVIPDQRQLTLTPIITPKEQIRNRFAPLKSVEPSHLDPRLPEHCMRPLQHTRRPSEQHTRRPSEQHTLRPSELTLRPSNLHLWTPPQRLEPASPSRQHRLALTSPCPFARPLQLFPSHGTHSAKHHQTAPKHATLHKQTAGRRRNAEFNRKREGARSRENSGGRPRKITKRSQLPKQQFPLRATESKRTGNTYEGIIYNGVDISDVLRDLPIGVTWARTTNRFFVSYNEGGYRRYRSFDPKRFNGDHLKALSAALEFHGSSANPASPGRNTSQLTSGLVTPL